MNADEFIAEINKSRPPDFPRADRGFLKRYHIVLGSGPYRKDDILAEGICMDQVAPASYYMGDVSKAISLLRAEQDLLAKFKSANEDRPSVGEPPVALSQLVVIHNSDAEQRHRIRNGLLDTGLINYAGYLYVNLSPFTGQTIDSLPDDAFAETEYRMEYSVLEGDTSEGKAGALAKAINPVFFASGLDKTLVQNYFLVGGRRQPESGPRAPLPRPLYQAFLNVDAQTPQSVMEFMDRNGVCLFPMFWAPDDIANHVASRGARPPRLGLLADAQQLSAFCAAEQKRMRGVILAAAARKWRQVRFPPVFPICENTLMEWSKISGYFDPGLEKILRSSGQTLPSLFEFKRIETDETVRVKRYYGWLSYMWAELAEQISSGHALRVCQRCGKAISPGKHGGRMKLYCSRDENSECYLSRKANSVQALRRGRM